MKSFSVFRALCSFRSSRARKLGRREVKLYASFCVLNEIFSLLKNILNILDSARKIQFRFINQSFFVLPCRTQSLSLPPANPSLRPHKRFYQQSQTSLYFCVFCAFNLWKDLFHVPILIPSIPIYFLLLVGKNPWIGKHRRKFCFICNPRHEHGK